MDSNSCSGSPFYQDGFNHAASFGPRSFSGHSAENSVKSILSCRWGMSELVYEK